MKLLKKIMELAANIFFAAFFKVMGKPRISKNLKKAVSLYEKDGFGKLFSQIRSWDAPYEVLEKIVPKKGEILDLGCGDGLLVNYLALSSPKRKITGIELNSDRIEIADKGIKNARFLRGDILTKKYPKADSVILAHVLHHLPSFASQEKVLEKLSGILKKKNKLIILEIDNKPLLKYFFSIIVDSVVVPILFEGKVFATKLFYRTSSEWQRLLEELGFSVEVKSTHRGMPFSHILIEATKK